MATITCRCPVCEQILRGELHPGESIVCAHCGQLVTEGIPNVDQDRLDHCLVCPSRELFVRKDFPQRLGVAIVVAGFAASSVTWYYHQVLATFGILFATAFLDVVLYLVMGNVLQCYRCQAEYRGIAQLETHQAFDLEIHERYRQAAARTRQQASSPPPTNGPPLRSGGGGHG
jgi:hypothetical protein